MSTENTLKAHHIRPTANRRAVLGIFQHLNYALSHSDIEREIGSSCDRVTIYRTLETFEVNGLIHKVADDSAITKYALCQPEDCNPHQHNDQHLHFQCSLCGHTYCLPLVKVPDIHLPQGYRLNTLSMVAEGLCNRCGTAS